MLDKNLLELGAEVIMVARGEEALNAASGIGEGKSAKVHLVRADVTTPEGRKEIFKVVEKIGRLDVLVNNVGTNIRKKFMEVSEDDLSHLLDTNLNSALAMCRDAHPWLLKGKSSQCRFYNLDCWIGHCRLWTDVRSNKALLLTRLQKHWHRNGRPKTSVSMPLPQAILKHRSQRAF